MGIIEKIYQTLAIWIELLLCRFNRLFPDKGVILMFHHISDEDINIMDCCKCKITRFKEIIRNVETDFEIVSIDDIYKENSKRVAVITFDDGCKDVYLNAYPFLKEHNIPFTVYLVSSFIGKKGYMSRDDILVLAKDPLVTIGFHTVKHNNLRFESSLECEMWKGKLCLETLIGRKISHFAFPYGKITNIGFKSIFYGFKLDYTTIVSTFDSHLSPITMLFPKFLPRKIYM